MLVRCLFAFEAGQPKGCMTQRVLEGLGTFLRGHLLRSFQGCHLQNLVGVAQGIELRGQGTLRHTQNLPFQDMSMRGRCTKWRIVFLYTDRYHHPRPQSRDQLCLLICDNLVSCSWPNAASFWHQVLSPGDHTLSRSLASHGSGYRSSTWHLHPYLWCSCYLHQTFSVAAWKAALKSLENCWYCWNYSLRSVASSFQHLSCRSFRDTRWRVLRLQASILSFRGVEPS